ANEAVTMTRPLRGEAPKEWTGPRREKLHAEVVAVFDRGDGRREVLVRRAFTNERLIVMIGDVSTPLEPGRGVFFQRQSPKRKLRVLSYDRPKDAERRKGSGR